MTAVVRAEDAYILLIEDDPNSYLVIEDLVKRAGFKHFYHRSNGTKLVPLLEALPHVDLILLDIGLPGEDGFAVLKRLRAHPQSARAYRSRHRQYHAPDSAARERCRLRQLHQQADSAR